MRIAWQRPRGPRVTRDVCRSSRRPAARCEWSPDVPIPTTRAEVTDLVESSFEKLRVEMDNGGAELAKLRCVDDWSVKDLLAVRAWWTDNVVNWIRAGQRGERPTTPAKGYGWNETPRLNADIVRRARHRSYRSIRAQLETGAARVLATIDRLDDAELLEVGVFEWAGKWPVSRWVSVNTARQYVTARTFIRRAVRRKGRGV